MQRTAILLLFSVLLLVSTTGHAKDKWIRVQSAHFTVIGNSGEKHLKAAATKLEQFRRSFSMMFPNVVVEAREPINVMVFNGVTSFRPFMPIRNGKTIEVQAYYQAGRDVSYIAMTGGFGQEDPFYQIFHEYVHSLTHNTMTGLPLWLNEGLAEFYSTFDVNGKETRVHIGAAIEEHIRTLRRRQTMPLEWLFSIQPESREYNEGDKRGVFYAESWALVHFLMVGDNSKRRPQFQEFVSLLLKGVTFEVAFPRVFGMSFANLEQELGSYVARSAFPIINFTPDEKLTSQDALITSEISEAESLFYLGDLLAHVRRPEAETYLQKATQLDPSFERAYASLGLIRLLGGNFDAAIPYIDKALALDKTQSNHLAHYYRARALLRQGNDGNVIWGEVGPEKAETIRSHLKRCLELSPTFLPAYSLLGFLAVITGEQLEDSAFKLKGILTFAPGNQRIAIELVNIYVRLQKYDEAIKLGTQLAVNGRDSDIRQMAQRSLSEIQKQKAKAKE